MPPVVTNALPETQPVHPQGKLLACGPPSEVLTARLLEAAYETPLHLVPTEDGSPPLIVLGSPRR